MDESPRGRGLEAQKRYICNNVVVLDLDSKKSILDLVETGLEGQDDHAGHGGPPGSIVKDTAAGVNVDLDRLGKIRPDLVRHIYNIVQARRAVLCSAYRSGPSD